MAIISSLFAMNLPPTVDPTEAPTGYRAVRKPASTPTSGNICRQCDWRKQCNDPATDLLAPGHRCMAGGVIAARDGKTYQRRDGASVLFKQILTA